MGANVLIKLTVLFFYRRIFIGRAFNICNWTLIGLSLVWFVYAVLSWLLYCGTHLKVDFEGGWLVCNAWGFDIQMGVFCLDSFIDFLLLLLPIPFVSTVQLQQRRRIADRVVIVQVWRLQLDLKRKIGVIVVFLIGGL